VSVSDDQLAAAAAALNAPEAIVKRSAEARAKADGIPVEQVLAAWAGGESTAAPETEDGRRKAEEDEPEASGPAEQPSEPEVAEPATEEEPVTPAEVPAAAATPAVPAVPAAAAAVDVPDLPPPPERVSPAAAMEYPEVVTVPTVGIKERTGGGVPGWLTSVFVAVPLFALFYLISNAGGVECGQGGALAVDPISGELVNCDGTPYEGSGAGGGAGGDFLADGEQVYVDVAACQACHGDQGQGVSAPALAGGAVLTTFGSCEDHVNWVRLGTQGWAAEVGDTYGDTGKPVGGGGTMPAFSTLSDEQLRAVVYFERVRFGGANPDEALADCGLGEPANGGGEGGDEGGAGEGGEPTGTTVAGGGGATETTVAGGGGATTVAP
jgi:mono/diheme cytochrome c family protein